MACWMLYGEVRARAINVAAVLVFITVIAVLAQVTFGRSNKFQKSMLWIDSPVLAPPSALSSEADEGSSSSTTISTS